MKARKPLGSAGSASSWGETSRKETGQAGSLWGPEGENQRTVVAGGDDATAD
jgi:hypothetical protein